MQDRIFSMLIENDEVTWRSIIYDLVNSGEMDPWDVDVSLLTKEYIKLLKKMKELNFRVSGKVLLAAAILLKIKSDRLLGSDLDNFDHLINPEQAEEEFYESLETEMGVVEEEYKLIPKTPQLRKRKVSLYDLVDALQQALEVKRRRVLQNVIPKQMEAPKKKTDISQLIKQLYSKITAFFKSHTRLTFTQIIPSEKKRDKVCTFIPLLHLANQQKLKLMQKQHLGEIEIKLYNKLRKGG